MSKVVVPIVIPASCEKCVFRVVKYWLPLTERKKGIYCQLDEEKEVFDLDYNDYSFKSGKCPLRELPERSDHPEHCDNGRF